MDASYDKSKIGKSISRGTDRAVYMYDTDQVIKFSTLSLLLGKKIHRKMMRDYSISLRYFGKYIVETKDVSGDVERQYVEIQKYINGVPFNKTHARDTLLFSQLQEIIQCMNAMVGDGYAPIDLIGHGSLTGRCLSNVFVGENGKLQIIDVTLLEGRSVGSIGLCTIPIFYLLKKYQNFILDYFWKQRDLIF